jgi:hypothetical protein
MTSLQVTSPMRSRVFLLSSTLQRLCLDAKNFWIFLRLTISRLAVELRAYACGFQITKEGTLNIVRQATAAGVKHISFVGTVGAVLDFTNPVIKAPLTDKDWNSLREDVALHSKNGTLVYTVAKTQAEQALWEFAEKHPELNLTTGTSQVCRLCVGIVPDRRFSQPNELYWAICGRLHHHSWSSQ